MMGLGRGSQEHRRLQKVEYGAEDGRGTERLSMIPIKELRWNQQCKNASCQSSAKIRWTLRLHKDYRVVFGRSVHFLVPYKPPSAYSSMLTLIWLSLDEVERKLGKWLSESTLCFSVDRNTEIGGLLRASRSQSGAWKSSFIWAELLDSLKLYDMYFKFWRALLGSREGSIYADITSTIWRKSGCFR